jgi:hypothetical protein
MAANNWREDVEVKVEDRMHIGKRPGFIMRLKATTRATIWGYTNSWSLARSHRNNGPSQECDVQLEIQGDSTNGYSLVMAPSGFFASDTWHATAEEAMSSAESLFGVTLEAWKKLE